MNKLDIQIFKTSRLLDFFSKKELTAQTGHEEADWPLVVLKELVDNPIDACEEKGMRPEIRVRVDEEGITVADNGPGIPPETVAGIVDFGVRVSSREAYVSPTRGTQGNALKTIVAMPLVLDSREGRVTITTEKVRHDITVRVNTIEQEPIIDHRETTGRFVKSGTVVKVHWPPQAGLSAGARPGAFFTNRRGLHLPEPSPDPARGLVREASLHPGHNGGLAEVAAQLPDLPPLVLAGPLRAAGSRHHPLRRRQGMRPDGTRFPWAVRRPDGQHEAEEGPGRDRAVPRRPVRPSQR
jgi:hypothetical protein